MFAKLIGGVLCLLVVAGVSPLSAAVLEVPAGFPTIQSALDAAVNGDEVHVAPGTYFENLTFLGKSVTLLSTGGPELTAIDGALMTRGAGEGSALIFEAGEGPATIVDGFTISSGTGRMQPVLDGAGTLLGNFRVGGGVLAVAANPTIRNCVFSQNQAQFGSGIFADGGAGLLIENCLFSGNSGLQGGGIYLRLLSTQSTISGCTFTGNIASTAGGGLMIEAAPTLLTGATFQSNDAILGGGALLQDATVTVLDSMFTQNDATLLGGGLLVFNAAASVQECRFIANTAGTGGAIGCDFGSATLDRCLLAHNSAGGDGGAIALSNNPFSLIVDRSTITGNTAGNGGALFVPATNASSSVLHGSIVVGNSLPTIADNGQTTVTYTNSEGPIAGNGNVDLPAGFRDALAGDYTLAPTSAMIDLGDPADPIDLDGTARDLGAFPFDQRADAIGDLACAVLESCDGTATATWTVADDYTSIDVLVDGIVAATLGGTDTTVDLVLGPAGLYTIELEPRFGNFIGARTSCTVDLPAVPAVLPVADLTCVVDELSCTADLTWTNQDSYQDLEILLDGTPFALLPGTATSATVPIADGSLTLITVTGVATCGGQTIPAASCSSGCNIDFAPFQRGDANRDGNLDISDPLTLLQHLFVTGPLGCQDAADANDDGALDISDAIGMIDAIFGAAPLPGSPTLGACGVDPTFGDTLTCVAYPSCP